MLVQDEFLHNIRRRIWELGAIVIKDKAKAIYELWTIYECLQARIDALGNKKED